MTQDMTDVPLCLLKHPCMFTLLILFSSLHGPEVNVFTAMRSITVFSYFARGYGCQQLAQPVTLMGSCLKLSN